VVKCHYVSDAKEKRRFPREVFDGDVGCDGVVYRIAQNENARPDSRGIEGTGGHLQRVVRNALDRNPNPLRSVWRRNRDCRRGCSSRGDVQGGVRRRKRSVKGTIVSRRGTRAKGGMLELLTDVSTECRRHEESVATGCDVEAKDFLENPIHVGV
jgi:hypothetical protein